MNDIGSLPDDRQEEVIFFTDPETGLRGLTVLDHAERGVCVGACRSRPYVQEDLALADALRQARTTTTKALIAGLPIAGGCTVLFSDSLIGSRNASPMPAIGRTVEALRGRYFLMPDLQGDLRDMDQAATGTNHVLGRPDDIEIDTVEATAIGIRHGIEAAIQRKLGRESLMGARIGIMGLGSVGFRLAELFRLEGAKLTVADRDPRRTERAVRALGINCVATEEIIHLDLDVLAPTAAKDSIDFGMVSHLRSKIIAGAVDNPLQLSSMAPALHERGILYAPDTIINAGGLISLAQPLLTQAERLPLTEQLSAIGSRMGDVIDRAFKECRSTALVAESMAKDALSTPAVDGEARLLAS